MPSTNLFSWFQQSCEAFRSSKFQLKLMIGSEDVNIHVTSINFGPSVWSTVDVNISIASCDIHLMQLVLHKQALKKNIFFNTTRSQIGSNIKIYSAQAMLENCSFLQANLSQNEPIIAAVNSKISVISSHVVNFIGVSFVRVTLGKAHITDVTFINSVAADSLIKVMNESHISVKNCSFSEIDGQCILVLQNSTVTIQNSAFENNTDRHFMTQNHQLVGYPLVFVSRSSLILRNSHFLSNTCPGAATVYLENGSFALLYDSDFVNNTVGVQATVESKSSKVKINRCRFLNNKGSAVHAMNNTLNNSSCLQMMNPEEGKTSSSKTRIVKRRNLEDGNQNTELCFKPEMNISNCTFVDNTAEYAAAIYAQGMSIVLQKSLFRNNSAMSNTMGTGGAIFFYSDNGRASMQVINTSFLHNRATFGGAIASASQTHIQGSTFTNNTAIYGGGAIYVGTETPQWKSDPILNVYNCTFVGNRAQGAAANVSASFDLGDGNVVYKSAYENASLGGAICCFVFNSSVQISSSVFRNNVGSASGGAIYTTTEPFHPKFTRNNSGRAISLSSVNISSSDSISETNIFQCRFYDNMARMGGALQSSDVSLVVQNSRFVNNSAVDPENSDYGLGGAIFHSSHNIHISSSYFKRNHASTRGGAVCIAFKTGDQNISLVINVSAARVQGSPSVSFAESHSVQHNSISNSTFIRNSATSGGAIAAYWVSLVLVNNHFGQNLAVRIKPDQTGLSADGGSVWHVSENRNDRLEISNSTFKQNRASYGGAVSGTSQTSITNQCFLKMMPWWMEGQFICHPWLSNSLVLSSTSQILILSSTQLNLEELFGLLVSKPAFHGQTSHTTQEKQEEPFYVQEGSPALFGTFQNNTAR